MSKPENLDVLLVYMPFGQIIMPSLGLALLKASLLKNGFTSTIKYFNLKFSTLTGKDEYMGISSGKPVELFGDWLFAQTLFDNLPPDEDYIKEILRNNVGKYLSKVQGNYSLKQSLDMVQEIKIKAENFIESCLEEIIAINPKIVGFSTTFQQNIPSLSLAKRIKEKLPETTIIFGGANCEGLMGLELINQFPFVDIVVSGEGDRVLPELTARILKNESCADIQGVICRENFKNSNILLYAQMVTDMDSLPYPDYDDYFAQFDLYGIPVPQNPLLLFESSRGCWWGEKKHCTFCGLNGSTMKHRSKSAERLLNEIKFLMDKYKTKKFTATDNILDLAYFKDFIPSLIREKSEANIFYEVKANLSKEQLKMLKEANINPIQPGIESFSTHVLDLMKKGVRGIQNVQLLKWCKEYDVEVFWNILWGFPGETSKDYFETAEIVSRISHLAPPLSSSRVNVHRFSPYFNNPEEYGITNMQPESGYKYIYPFNNEVIYNLAYQFTYDYPQDEDFRLGIDASGKALMNWFAHNRESDLFFIDQEDALVVFDLRPIATETYYILYNKERFIYLLCDKVQPFAKIKQEYEKYFQVEAVDAEINLILDSLIAKNLLLKEGNSYLSLAVPMGTYSPKQEILKKLVMTLKNQPGNDQQVRITENNELLIELNV
jgi:ribosomal peptide maturation radical SAM protein 1